jgi:SH3-like domain-containing protein
MVVNKALKRIFAFALLFILVLTSDGFAQRFAVMVSAAKIRSGPGKKHSVIWRAEKYYPLNILEKEGKWYRFKDFEGDGGWIHATLIGDIITVITKRENCNIRSGPGKEKNLLYTLDKGIPFKVIERKDNWIHVEHADGDKGWIHESLVW